MDIQEAFKIAIKGEIEGRELYLAASERTKDKKAKTVFKNLSEEEDSHFKTLQTLAKSYSLSEKLEIPKLPKLEKFEDAESPIFSKEFKDAIKDKHYEISTLSIGMKLEAESAKFYREFSEKTDNKELKDFLLYLSSWENEHYMKLKDQLSRLEDHYYTQNSMFRF
jgi:rubrerythrin